MKRKKSKKPKIALPDCILSNIFSKLGLKDLVKTSTLSKHWCHEWALRMDLNFNFHNMFDSNTVQELPQSLPLLQGFQSEFATRLDQFMLHYQGDMISSIRLSFPLGPKYNDVIDRMISKGIAKGAKRIELLFSSETNDPRHFLLQMQLYKFSFTLLSDTGSLTYLHLKNCLLVAPLDFSGLKNLRTLVLQLVNVHQNLLQGLFSNCNHIVDFTLDHCDFKSDLKIVSSKLFHLNIVNCGIQIGGVKSIDIIASNLSSIEYSFNSSYPIHKMNIQAQMLSKFRYSGNLIFSYIESSYAFGFSGLKNVTTVVFDGIHQNLQQNVIRLLFSECLQLEDVTFKNCWIIHNLNITSTKLHHLKIIDCDYQFPNRNHIDVDALNLSSFEYSGHTTIGFNVKAPMLLKVFWNAAKREKIQHPFGPIARLLHIENLSMIMSTSQVSHSTTKFACWCFIVST